MTTINIQRRTRTVILSLRRKGDAKHGTVSGYGRGCGCAACRDANREAQRKKRDR